MTANPFSNLTWIILESIPWIAYPCQPFHSMWGKSKQNWRRKERRTKLSFFCFYLITNLPYLPETVKLILEAKWSWVCGTLVWGWVHSVMGPHPSRESPLVMAIMAMSILCDLKHDFLTTFKSLCLWLWLVVVANVQRYNSCHRHKPASLTWLMWSVSNDFHVIWLAPLWLGTNSAKLLTQRRLKILMWPNVSSLEPQDHVNDLS